MAFQFSTAARNAALDAIETAAGTAPVLTIRSGAAPVDCAAADSGTALAVMTLPSDWLAAGAAGAKTLLGVWQAGSAAAAGTAGHFRIKQAAVCHIQGGITASGGGGDMTLDNIAVALGQQVTITAFTITAGGA